MSNSLTLEQWAKNNSHHFNTFSITSGQISAKNEPENEIWKNTEQTSEKEIMTIYY